MLKINGNVLKINGDWLIPHQVPPTVYNVILNQTTGGTISAQPMSGVDGTTVTLSNTPATNYTFAGYNISGSTLYDTNKFDINGSDVTCSGSFSYVDPYNPLNLPPYTIRLKFSDGVTPTFDKGTSVQVSSSPNIWDLTYENSNWYALLRRQTQIIEVIGGNTTGVTNMSEMFSQNFIGARLTTISLLDTSNVTNMSNMFKLCDSLVNIPLLNTSNVTNMSNMFAGCNSLTSIPLFDTTKVTNMNSTFDYCHYVQSGALALYQQASTQANPPTNHSRTFGNCGDLTQSGSAELAQIPSSWGGTGA